MVYRALIFIFTIGFIVASCSQEEYRQNNVFLYENTLDINYGEDICSFSGETIERVRFGGKIIMDDGTEHKFMSAECTAGFYLGIDDKSKVEIIQIVDFAHGQKYLPVDELVYLRSPLQPSPNGLYLTPIDNSNERMKTYIYDAYPGEFFTWDEVLDLVDREWEITQTTAQNIIN